ncbi:hypothetical protein NEPAR06_0971 [Nematocida parisii]|uniref:Microsporidial 8TM transmembrane domain-containing protein n=1 Tax=Nematocida parisii (strain ERTm3) TaxID=935791 RepID=I3EH69_NEMP3|nr:uncharacterized protein NEPG_00340 [Nematocida parisii ERTm1]EIJ88566.1 hypothetical protein NEQG_01256 [Nematocida parisii ERTm3]KAI5129913.1 hypothetical protein NEPAR03_1883 [Nematocida parisii]EIJ94816.1 hypothetical protein NEPG_00340 [Nematocida parisii ERTm1]KAI5130145.1 hypothetical protein NEPAR08_1883 [Nematocida parisii]KAI5143932.1 hypothetical protein NEPAR04_2013 [Nematocida parisii]|eukprot:XP_013058172.1 hypothetical protein NEPG_00340 [Nematocida parisii ERTm1]
MERGVLQYMHRNIMSHVFSVIIRWFDISKCLSRYSYYDLVEAEQYIQGNPFAGKPSITLYYFTKTLLLLNISKAYSVHTFMYGITGVCDFTAGYLLDCPVYFLVTSLLPNEIYSIICLLIVVCYKKKALAKYVGPVLALLCAEGSYDRCAPGINAYWYINMQMFKEYQGLFQDMFRASHYFLLSLTLFSRLISTKLYLIMVFKDLGYRGYAVLWCILSLEKFSNDRVFNLCLGLCSIGVFIEYLVWYMLIYCGVGNMNFLCWSNVITIISTGIATVLHESNVQKEKRRKR